ncbi:hypothetical protein B9Z19DRAFT_127749 [Tuber borchii]|uniref:Extracellular membrane protein CFEM domain-containing protein n=1 Tax=Tuber borchii TaxID=42251 RepID=A0A2T6ZQX6_TUBBO|nr:hypothetical protein B9Z19DRAFT_127749 [Tuber borchii]
MKLTIFAFASIAGAVVSAGGGLALRAGSCPAAASKICGSVAGELKDCCPEATTCTVVGRKTYCCSSGDTMCSQGRITTCAVSSWSVNADGYCSSSSSSASSSPSPFPSPPPPSPPPPPPPPPPIGRNSTNV